ncbi:PREDICTED: sperm-specific H1/protamine-like protein type 2 [Priapulus caudatus]|uniref:Sperm-specific H1/protamine-like protein type 2 n=1 Tax=Priapulus caudatus TaxID=37621 RepID=A0ABM1DRU6_PRICU|nr:PREDICTED: sperm-specific H1/protamine-like protein type 2 [Priapulus caudatus]
MAASQGSPKRASPVKGSPKKVVKKRRRSGSKAKKATHPTTLDMVVAAIRQLKNPRGSSAQAIRRYILATYKVDANRVGGMLRRAFKAGLEKGAIARPKGSTAIGAIGRFRAAKPVPKPKAKKAAPKKAKKPRAKKAATQKKAKKPRAKKAAKSPKKVKKTTKKASPKKAKKPVKKATKPKAKKPVTKKSKSAAAKKPKAKKTAKK